MIDKGRRERRERAINDSLDYVIARFDAIMSIEDVQVRRSLIRRIIIQWFGVMFDHGASCAADYETALNVRTAQLEALRAKLDKEGK